MSSANYAIKNAIDTLDIETARSMLREALKNPDAETYYLASLVALDNEQKKEFLQKAIEFDPFHEKARFALKESGSKISEQTKIERNTSTTPSSTSEIDINQFITANVQGSIDSIAMYLIPIETGLVRTQLRKGSKVLLVERDERAEWFMCGYLSPVGLPIIGWLPSVNLGNVNYMNREINLLDLPITRFEPHNTRAEVKKLIEEKKRKLKNVPLLTAGLISLTVIMFVFFCFGLGLTLGGILPGLIFVALAVFFIFPILILEKRWKEDKKFNAPLTEELERLNTLQKEIRNDYERLRDDQRITMGIQSGLDTARSLVGIAGETVAKKILHR